MDVRRQLAGAARVYQPFTPIPVVQVGDRLGPDTITGIAVYDPIANAAHDEAGGIRTMRRGDHRVAFWASTSSGQVIVRGNHFDSDQDGLLDHWETTGIDMDQDGVVDLRLSQYGADPFTRDLFLQVDWVGKPGYDLFKPAGGTFSSTVAGAYSLFETNLRSAEKLTGRVVRGENRRLESHRHQGGNRPARGRRGRGGLAEPSPLHQSGSRGSPGRERHGMPGNPSVLPQVVYFGQPGLSVFGVNVRSFQEIKDNFFGTADKNARLLAFHYMVFAPFQDFQPNYPKTPYSATISTVSGSDVEVNQPLSAFPQARAGRFS